MPDHDWGMMVPRRQLKGTLHGLGMGSAETPQRLDRAEERPWQPRVGGVSQFRRVPYGAAQRPSATTMCTSSTFGQPS
jgi:hypothetical protein